jgi:methyl-accepting chemotaxis protein
MTRPSQQPAVPSRVERLVERAMALAVDERDDDLAVARLAWLARNDQAALAEAGEVCLERTELGLVVGGRAAGLLARVGRRPPGMRDRAMVSYGGWSAVQADIGGRGHLEGATANMSTEVGDLDAALAALYQLPLEQFVATRDQLARRLRAAGDRASARQVASLRRPPVSAWAANQLASAAPNAVAELLEAGAALRQAQQDALAGQPGAARQLRTATAHLRAAITRLSARAETLLARAGHAASDATLTRLAATLQAAATGDEATRAALAQGRLPGDLDPAGFGLDLGSAPAEPAAPAEVAPAAPAPAGQAEARRERARAAARRALEQARRAAEQAQAALDQAQGLAASRQQAAQAAHQHAEQLAAVARDLADQAAAAATAAEEARLAADAADRDADEVADRVRVAEQAVEAAEAAHAAAVASLEGLEDPT